MMNIWNFSFSQVRLALQIKNVDCTVVYMWCRWINGTPRSYLQLNKNDTVPTLKQGYIVLSESDEIINYLDENYSKYDKLFEIGLNS